MDKSSALDTIENIKWDKYATPEYYSSYLAKACLLKLVSIESINDHPEICHEVLSGIGNDHAGTYYPIIFEVIDFLIDLESSYENEFVRKATNAILSDFSYFEIDYGNLKPDDLEALIMNTKSKLNKYKD
jgi:hypothetical protein